MQTSKGSIEIDMEGDGIDETHGSNDTCVWLSARSHCTGKLCVVIRLRPQINWRRLCPAPGNHVRRTRKYAQTRTHKTRAVREHILRKSHRTAQIPFNARSQHSANASGTRHANAFTEIQRSSQRRLSSFSAPYKICG